MDYPHRIHVHFKMRGSSNPPTAGSLLSGRALTSMGGKIIISRTYRGQLTKRTFLVVIRLSYRRKSLCA